MTVALRLLAAALGLALVVSVTLSAVRTVVVPRSVSSRITKFLFLAMRSLFNLRLRSVKTYEDRDRTMALYAPITLVLLPGVWVGAIIVGFAGVFMGIDGHGLRDGLTLSGSSITTLGFSAPIGAGEKLAAVTEAVIGLGVVALMISYLPSIYSSFQRRELLVCKLEVRAGDPPSAVTMIKRHNDIGWLDHSTELFSEWEEWFADIEETHTSQPALMFFRSPMASRSWITAAGAVLDGAALMVTTVDGPHSPEAQLCLRAGFLSLRRIADSLGLPHDPDPSPTDAISIDRTEFEQAYADLRSAGVPLKADLEAAWIAFSGWRVNYDRVLVGLAGLLMAPYAPWSSDRSVASPSVLRAAVRRR